MKTKKGERIEDLQCNGLKIIQNANLYTFTSDSVVLANFVKLKPNEKCLEIGMGCGVISILLSAKNRFKEIVGFELQEEMFDLAKRNIELNELGEKIKIVRDDVRNFKKYFACGEFDVVFSNPPYMVTSTVGKNECRGLARHEKALPLGDLVRTTTKMLKFGGRAYFVYSASRSVELISCMVENGLEPKTMFFTENGKGRVVLVVIEAVKGGKHGVNVFPNLITNDTNGDYYEKLQTRNFLK